MTDNTKCKATHSVFQLGIFALCVDEVKYDVECTG